MARKLDILALGGVLIVLLFALGIVLFRNIWLSLTISSALSLATVFSIYFFSKPKKSISPSQFAMEMTLKGNEYLTNIIKTTLKNDKIESGSNYILFENTAIFSLFKFGNLSSSDVLNIHRTLENSGISKVFIFANGIDKQAYKTSTHLGIQLKLVKTSSLVRYLDKHNALPDFKKTKSKPSLQSIFATVFSRGNFKAYAFSGTILVLTSFITPLKVYYIVSGTICLLLAIATLLFGNGSISGTNVFKELKNAACKDCVSTDNQIGDNLHNVDMPSEKLSENISNDNSQGCESKDNSHDCAHDTDNPSSDVDPSGD